MEIVRNTMASGAFLIKEAFWKIPDKNEKICPIAQSKGGQASPLR
jgi:hypothetical protein